MRFKSFRVRKFRNVVDSGEIKVEDQVTCLVGKNEAGKSGLLEALYLLNPAYDEKFELDEQYPRWLLVRDRKHGDVKETEPISATFLLDDEEKSAVTEVLGAGVIREDEIKVSKTYGGKSLWTIRYDDTAASENLSEQFAPSIAKALKGCKKLSEIREALGKLGPSEGEDGVGAEHIEAARTILSNLQLEKGEFVNRIINILDEWLPSFFRFTSYSTLSGRIDLNKLVASKNEEGPATSAMQTARALLQLAGTDVDQLKEENYELRKGELEAVSIELTRQVFEYWKQNPHLEVNIDVDKQTVNAGNGQTAVSRFLDIRLRDRRTGYSNNFGQRSAGFQWFFSFLAAFSEFEDKASPIVLLDEPGMSLHGRAQADYLRFINERLAPAAPVIYTTHSPFMVEAGRLERVRVIEDKGPPDGAVASEDGFATDRDSLFPLQAALGYDLAQNIFVGPNNLIVEGISEFLYLKVMSLKCVSPEHESLDFRWRILPAGGATNIPTFVTLVGPHLDVTVLVDSDTRGLQRLRGMIEQKLLTPNRLIYANEVTGTPNADIEDLFNPSEYLEIYNHSNSDSLKVSDLPDGDRITKRIAAKRGSEFDHGKTAEYLLNNHHKIKLSKSTLDRFGNLFKRINGTLEAK